MFQFIILKIYKEVSYLEMREPCGWFIVPLRQKLLDETEKYYIKLTFRPNIYTMNI